MAEESADLRPDDGLERLNDRLAPLVTRHEDRIIVPADREELGSVVEHYLRSALDAIQNMTWKNLGLVLGALVIFAYFIAVVKAVPENPMFRVGWEVFADSVLRAAYSGAQAVELTFVAIWQESISILETTVATLQVAFLPLWTFVVSIINSLLEPIHGPSLQDLLNLGAEVMTGLLKHVQPITDHIASVANHAYKTIMDVKEIQPMAAVIQEASKDILVKGGVIGSAVKDIGKALAKARDVPADFVLNLLSPLLKSALSVQLFALAAALHNLSGGPHNAAVSYIKKLLVTLLAGKSRFLYKALSFVVANAFAFVKYFQEEYRGGQLSLATVTSDTKEKFIRGLKHMFRNAKTNPLLVLMAIATYYGALLMFSSAGSDMMSGWRAKKKKKKRTKRKERKRNC